MEWRIWVPGKPKSQQSKGKHSRNYKEAIRQAATAVMSSPLDSHHIEIEIVFAPKTEDRPDVDNVVKPILDALKGIAAPPQNLWARSSLVHSKLHEISMLAQCQSM